MTYKIEKGKKIQSRSKYPFEDMEPGDSFPIPVKEEDWQHRRTKVQGRVLNAAKRFGITVTTRSIKKENVVRVWRTEEKDDGLLG